MTQPAAAACEVREITGGVDTHTDTHTAAALDPAGRVLGHRQFPTTSAGYTALLAWLRTFGEVVLVGIEGTGAYGAGLALHLRVAGIALVEVDRPDRATRRHLGKSDPVDAEAAARAAQSGRATGVPKHRDGQVEALRVLRVARRCAIAQRADVQHRIKTLIITAPAPCAPRCASAATGGLITHRATRRPDRGAAADPATALVIALRTLARRHQQLTTEIDDLDTLIGPLVEQINPALCARSASAPTSPGSS